MQRCWQEEPDSDNINALSTRQVEERGYARVPTPRQNSKSRFPSFNRGGRGSFVLVNSHNGRVGVQSRA